MRVLIDCQISLLQMEELLKVDCFLIISIPISLLIKFSLLLNQIFNVSHIGCKRGIRHFFFKDELTSCCLELAVLEILLLVDQVDIFVGWAQHFFSL